MNNFTKNKAGIMGGGIYYDYDRPLGLKNGGNIFEGNTALYGSDFGSFPTQLQAVNNQTTWTKELVSGKEINESIKIGLYDQDDQLFNIDSDSECVLNALDITAVQI
jgi:hypothetical protein